MKRTAVMAVIALLAAGTMFAGDTVWTRTYSGPGATINRGAGVATLGDDIFIAGRERRTNNNVMLIRYRANGDTVWVRTYDLDADESVQDVVLAPDTSLVVLVTVMTPVHSAILIKLTTNGDTVWTRRCARLSATNLALNEAGDIFVYGALFGTTMNESLCLIKYTAAGSESWRRSYRFGDRHSTAGCCADLSGNVIGTGEVMDSTGANAMVVKFTATGDTAWRIYYPDLTGAMMGGVALDPAGLFVFNAARGTMMSVARCSTNGFREWNIDVPLRGGPESYNAVACDADNNVIVAGMDANNFMAMAKLDPTGALVCIGSSEIVATPYAAGVDSEKRPIVTGQMNIPPPPACLTAKFTGVPGVQEPNPGPATNPAGLAVGARVLRPGQALTVDVSTAGVYAVVLLDVRGALARRLHHGHLDAGRHSFSVGRLAAGAYCLRVTSHRGASDARIVQVR